MSASGYVIGDYRVGYDPARGWWRMVTDEYGYPDIEEFDSIEGLIAATQGGIGWEHHQGVLEALMAEARGEHARALGILRRALTHAA